MFSLIELQHYHAIIFPEHSFPIFLANDDIAPQNDDSAIQKYSKIG